MRLRGSLATLALLAAALILAGCGRDNQAANATSVTGKGNTASVSPSSSPADNIRRVTVGELRDMLEQNKAVVVDVRGTEPYKHEHIKGALDVAENELSSRSGELPKDKLIVFYCS